MTVGIEPGEFGFARDREYVGIVLLMEVLPERIAVAGLHAGRTRWGVKTGLGVDQTNCGFVTACPPMEHGEDAYCPCGVFGRAEQQQTPVP